MKYKRLTGISVFLALALLAGAALGWPLHSGGEGLSGVSLQGEALLSASGRTRSTALKTEEEINAAGLQTQLPEGFKEALTHEKYTLFFDEKTAAVALRVKKTGEVFLSNPADADEESLVGGREKDALKAQMLITYYDESGREDKQNSFTDCIQNETMTCEIKNESLTVFYQFGKSAVSLSDVPQQISKERFESVLEKLSEEDAKALKSEYSLATLTGAEGEYRATLLEKYKNLENNDVYFLKYTSDHIVEKVKKLFDTAGYTAEDVAFDYKENQLEYAENTTPFFKAALVYTLTDNGLAVTLDTKSIEYNPKMPPYRIRILEYFLSGGQQDDGYLLVPDGSGSLIALNNGKTGESAFSMPVYGADTAQNLKNRPDTVNKLSLPVFGMKKGASAMLAVIEEGDANAWVNARVAGMENTYNNVYGAFTFEEHDVVNLFSTATSVLRSKQPYEGLFRIQYVPLEPESGYSEMAAAYRDYLSKAKGLPAQKAGEAYPLFIELVGAVPKEQNGLQALFSGSTEVMCDFSQAKEILQAMEDIDLKVRYTGWDATGLTPDLAQKLRFGAVGSKGDFKALSDYCQSKGIALYMSVDGQLYQKGSKSLSVKGLDKDMALRFTYNYMSGSKSFGSQGVYQLTPACLTEQTGKLQAVLKKMGITGVAPSDLSEILYADYNTKHRQNRQTAKDTVAQSLQTLASGAALALSNPNGYALPMAEYVSDLPVSDSGYRITDEAVPFYQMAVRGSVDYAGPSLTYAPDYKTALLYCVEYGAGLNYTLMAKEPSVLKTGRYNYLNRGLFNDWKDIIREDYGKAEAVLKPLQGLKITAHEKLTDDVYKTVYENGRAVYVNYRNEAVIVDGISVEGKGWCAA